MLSRTDPRLLALGACLLLGACATSVFTPDPVQPSGMPYEGLGENSYGPRSAGQFRLCDPQDAPAGRAAVPSSPPSRLAGATSAVASSIGAAVAAPVQGLMKVDATLQALGLARHFRAPAGKDHPPVAVLVHSRDSIVFWHSAKQVGLQDVMPAAQAYCAAMQKSSLYRGSASRCPAAERDLAGQPVLHTFVISAYACTGRR